MGTCRLRSGAPTRIMHNIAAIMVIRLRVMVHNIWLFLVGFAAKKYVIARNTNANVLVATERPGSWMDR